MEVAAVLIYIGHKFFLTVKNITDIYQKTTPLSH